MDIRDIARLSGYSLGTVSRVINGHPNVSERARERVMAVVEEQGYEPNLNAKNLKMTAGSSITVLVKGARNLFFAELVERTQSLLLAAGEETQVVYLDEDADEVQEAIQHCRLFHPKALVFLGGDPAHFRLGFERIDIPCVLLSNTAATLGFKNLSSFTVDDAEASGCIIDELWANGHRRIGIIGGNRQPGQIGTLRLEGAVDALINKYDADFVLARDYEPSRFSLNGGYDAAVRLLRRSPDLTAVFCLGDIIAAGTMRSLFDMGRRVPDDISVAGFDGLPMTQFYVPRLTTIHQDAPRMAERAVATLIKRLQQPKLEGVHEVVPFQLYRRESVRNIAA